MTSIDELTPPKNSLAAEDLDGDDVTLTIKGYEIKEFQQTNDSGEKYIAKKPILSFEGTDKTFVCNVTNMKAIAYVYGKEIDSWIGKKITLFPTLVTFGNKEVPGIRVRVPKEGGGKPKFLQNQAPLDDDIPF